jgi:hypothetical protein
MGNDPNDIKIIAGMDKNQWWVAIQQSFDISSQLILNPDHIFLCFLFNHFLF